jgi:hypothetical protein
MVIALLPLTALAQIPQNDHVALGRHYVDNIDPATPADNNYGGSYPDIYVRIGSDGHTESLSRCGSFLAMLLKQAYPTLITNTGSGYDVVKRLTLPIDPAGKGSTSPNASQWHDAIAAQTSYDKPGDGTASPYHFVLRGTVGDIQVGDLLAAEYAAGGSTSGDSTGHIMVVNSALRAPNAGETGPAIANTQQWVVEIIDSSNGIHGADTRTTNGNTGLGRGSILIYETLGTGAIQNWSWGLGAATTVYTMAQRHMVAGVLRGPATGMQL